MTSRWREGGVSNKKKMFSGGGEAPPPPYFIFIFKYNREFTQRQEYDYDYINGCLKGLGLIVIVSLNVGLR